MICPFAEWRGPVPGRTPNGMGAVTGAVFHIMGASMSAADGWFHNPQSRVSAHFGIGQDGKLVQWVDTADRAWHAGAANSHWIGVETEGASGPLAAAGIAKFAELYRWLHGNYGIPFQTTDDPANGHGLGWHGMGGVAWGNHPYCPGPERKAQRATVIALAQGQPQEDDMTPDQAKQLTDLHELFFSPQGMAPDVPNGHDTFIELLRRMKNTESATIAIKNKTGA